MATAFSDVNICPTCLSSHKSHGTRHHDFNGKTLLSFYGNSQILAQDGRIKKLRPRSPQIDGSANAGFMVFSIAEYSTIWAAETGFLEQEPHGKASPREGQLMGFIAMTAFFFAMDTLSRI